MFTAIQIILAIAALGASFAMCVFPGVNHMPTWAIYTCMGVGCLGAGAAINLAFWS